MRMHTYAEAAIELNIPVSWLENHKDGLPHTEFGPTHIRFSDDDLDEIRRMHRVWPSETRTEAPVETPASVTSLPAILRDLKPAGARYRSSATA